MAGCLIEYILSRRLLLIAFCFKSFYRIYPPIFLRFLVQLTVYYKVRILTYLQLRIVNAQLAIYNLCSTNIFNKIVTEVSDFEKKHNQFEFSDKLEHRIRHENNFRWKIF